ALLLARSPEDRLKMGCSMSATARALVRASVLAQDPQASPAALRRALFLRFYGAEFEPAEREQILVSLAGVEPPPVESCRRVPVTWDDLEMALTANPAEWERWFTFRDAQLRAAAREWLAENDLEPSATPSERRDGE